MWSYVTMSEQRSIRAATAVIMVMVLAAVKEMIIAVIIEKGRAAAAMVAAVVIVLIRMALAVSVMLRQEAYGISEKRDMLGYVLLQVDSWTMW